MVERFGNECPAFVRGIASVSEFAPGNNARYRTSRRPGHGNTTMLVSHQLFHIRDMFTQTRHRPFSLMTTVVYDA